MSVFEEIRAAARQVSERARSVHIDPQGVERLAASLQEELPNGDLATVGSDDPAHLRLADDAA